MHEHQVQASAKAKQKLTGCNHEHAGQDESPWQRQLLPTRKFTQHCQGSCAAEAICVAQMSLEAGVARNLQHIQAMRALLKGHDNMA